MNKENKDASVKKLLTVKPSPTELAVLKVLWQQSPLSAREIHVLISQKLNWSYSSTRKTLERMTDKQLLTTAEVHGLKVFTPGVNKVKVLALFARDFAQSVFEFDKPLPVSMFAESKLLDENELLELEKLLNDGDDNND